MNQMALDVSTNDAAALTDSDLDELASMEEAFSAGQLSKAKEDWVLITTARFGGALHGFTFSTLERIGGRTWRRRRIASPGVGPMPALRRQRWNRVTG